MADDTDPQPQSYSSTGNVLETLGGIISGLTRSHSDAGLGAVGNMLNQHAYAQYEKATRPTLLKNMQKNFPQMGLSDDMVNYYGGMDTPTFQSTVMPTLQKQMLEHGKGEGASQRVTMNGISGDYFPSSGRTAWMSKGEDFYAPQKAAKGPGSIAALWQTDPTKAAQIENQQAAIRAKYAKAPTFNINNESPVNPSSLRQGADGKWYYLTANKLGVPELHPVDVPPGLNMAAPTPAAKPMTPAQKIDMQAKAEKKVKDNAPFLSSTAQIKGATDDLIANAGINPKTMEAFKDGERYMFSDGRTRTWHKP